MKMSRFMPERNVHRQRRRRLLDRRLREGKLLLKGALDTEHPIMAHIIPIRRCNLSCAYCNEYDNYSKPVALDTMLHRLELLGKL
ncbi:MAG: radical SAM protein, partial [Acidobacteriaceae bacterium]|nr:radical SAM protein [Acidobacteriaceae bacterium]